MLHAGAVERYSARTEANRRFCAPDCPSLMGLDRHRVLGLGQTKRVSTLEKALALTPMNWRKARPNLDVANRDFKAQRAR